MLAIVHWLVNTDYYSCLTYAFPSWPWINETLHTEQKRNNREAMWILAFGAMLKRPNFFKIKWHGETFMCLITSIRILRTEALSHWGVRFTLFVCVLHTLMKKNKGYPSSGVSRVFSGENHNHHNEKMAQSSMYLSYSCLIMITIKLLKKKTAFLILILDM